MTATRKSAKQPPNGLPPRKASTRPTPAQTYYMEIADAVRRKASCCKRHVGAVLVLGNRIISTGYNGTPEGMANCDEYGCIRCAQEDLFPAGSGYDVCICVHAEQNALLTAARYGISVKGATVYTTLAPCFTCMKELLQAQVHSVYYCGDFPTYGNDLDMQLRNIIARFKSVGGRTRKLVVPGVDPDLRGALKSPRKSSAA